MKTPNTETKPFRLGTGWGVAAIVVLFVFFGAIVAPKYLNAGLKFLNDTVALGVPTVPDSDFRLGLDLQGGVQLIYEADTTQVTPGQEAAAVEGARDVIERRVNGLGVGEATVQTAQIENAYRLNIELPGVTNISEAITMIGETPILEFKEQSTEAPALTPEQQTKLNADNAAAKTKAEALLARLKKGEDFGVLASESDDVNTKNDAGKLGFIPNVPPVTELYAWAKNKTEGTVSDTLIVSPQGYNIVKRGAEREGEAQVKASHLLVCYLGAKDCAATMTKEEARTKITDLAKQATIKNFAKLVKENSTDLSNKDTGGDLGYFTKAQMVPSFAEAAFAAKDGTIVGPVETEFGFHLIYRQAARQEKEYEVSRILVATKTATDILGTGNWKSTGLSGKQLERAEVVADQQTGAAQVSLKFNSEGAELFRQITQRNLQKPIAIFLDNTPEPLTTPNVNTVIPDGQAVITGNFTLPEAQKLAQRLNAGALPVPVELVSQQVIGATLGAEALNKSLQAGFASLLIIMVFMVAVYRLPGFISAISLCLYTLITLGLFKFMDVTITLAGIAGFIMSLGVAIDANVLIFERLKEELGLGKNLRTAMEEGFVRAWTSIRDGNAATIITGVILIWFGSSFVQGFALTLIIGTLVSLFTAITVTRTLMRFILPWFKNNGGWLFLGATPKKN